MSFHDTIRQFPSRLAATLATTLAAALMATLIAAPVWATSNAYCQEHGRKLYDAGVGNTLGTTTTGNPLNSKWTGTRCYHDGQFASDNEARQNEANNRFDHPDARAVYYGNPPAEYDAARGLIGQNQICITFPNQPPELTARDNIKRVGVHGGDGYHDSGVVLTESGRASGSFLHFGDVSIDGGSRCVSARGRLANAVPGTGFPVELRVKTAGRRVDATNPGMRCPQSTVVSALDTWQSTTGAGQCLQWHYTFRNMPHCVGAGGGGGSSAGQLPHYGDGRKLT